LIHYGNTGIVIHVKLIASDYKDEFFSYTDVGWVYLVEDRLYAIILPYNEIICISEALNPSYNNHLRSISEKR
jgi:hypothetical protein